MTWKIRTVTEADIPAITEIYRYYVLETDISFDLEPPTVKEKRSDLQKILQFSPYLVAELEGKVIGYAYAKPWEGGVTAYKYTYESTIYLDNNRDLTKTKGLGSALYQHLIDELKAKSEAHVLLGVPTVGNIASEKLHEKLGFKLSATFNEFGYKFDRWLGVHFYTYLLK